MVQIKWDFVIQKMFYSFKKAKIAGNFKELKCWSRDASIYFFVRVRRSQKCRFILDLNYNIYKHLKYAVKIIQSHFVSKSMQNPI